MTVTVEKRGKKWRIIEASSRGIAMRGRTPIDAGGHYNEKQAKAQARAINASNKKKGNK